MDQPNKNYTLVMRATQAQKEYAAAIADVNRDSQHAISAIAAYGEALLVGRQEHADSNKAFAEWVSVNKLDAGDPWRHRPERTAAMRVAEIVRSADATDPFAGCQTTRPTHVVSWWRKQHPKPKSESQLKAEATRKAKKEAAKGVATTPSDGDLFAQAEASLAAKGKMMAADKAIAILKKKQEKMFWSVVGEEVRKGIVKANDAVRKQLAELVPAHRQLEARYAELQRSKGVFTVKQFRQLQTAVHPDSSASVEVRNALLDLLVKNEDRLVKPEGTK